MRPIRRVVAAWLVLAMAVLAGCSTATKSQREEQKAPPEPAKVENTGVKPGEVEVSFWESEGSAGYKDTLFISGQLEKAIPGSKVKLTYVGGQESEKTRLRLLDGNPPDVMLGLCCNAYSEKEENLEKGLVYDLTDALQQKMPGSDKKWVDTINPMVMPYISEKGRIYAIPREVTVQVFYYNKKIFADNGLQPPKNWAEFVKVADALKAKNITPLTVTGTFGGYTAMYWDYLTQRQVGYEKTKDVLDGKVSILDDPGYLEAAKKLKHMVDNQYFVKGFEGTDFTGAQVLFFQGKAAMILMGSWLVSEMKSSIPGDFQIGTFTFPTVEDGKGNANVLFGSVNNLAVPAKAKRPDLAVEWLKLYSDQNYQTYRAEALGNISGFLGVPSPSSNPGVGDILDAASKGGSFIPSYYGVYGQPQQLREAWHNPVTSLMFGKMTPEQMLQEIDKGIKAFYKK